MSEEHTLTTARLRLRLWQEADLLPFAALNADPRVMEHFPNTLSREESDAAAGRIREHFRQRGFGLWAVEVRESQQFIGFVGLNVPALTAHFTPCVEVGWRLDYDHWGCGYATEAARAAIDDGFRRLNLDEIVSYTAVENARSRRVMERLGMPHLPADDFDHPSLAAGHPLRRHVLYRLPRSSWQHK